MTEQRSSLIVYAVPLGPLGEQLDDFWRRADDLRPNAALEYPPHCTVTGFFHRRPEDVAGVVEALERAVADDGRAPVAPVVSHMVLDGDWVGLVLEAPALVDLAERFARLAPTGRDDDAVRPKADPHLSLAYEFPRGAASTLAALAAATVRTDASALWELRLYEGRRGGSWRSLAAWSLGPTG